MAIKYIVMEDKKKVMAIMDSDTTYDAVNKIYKMCGADSPVHFYSPKYLMPRAFKATATCCDTDTFDAEVGKKVAKEKLLRNYYRSFDKRIDMFRSDLINLNARFFEIPEINA